MKKRMTTKNLLATKPMLNAVQIGGLLKWIRLHFNKHHSGWSSNKWASNIKQPIYTDKQIIKAYHEQSRDRRKK